MNLRALAQLCLGGAMLGLLVLGTLGFQTWRTVAFDLDTLENLQDLRRDAANLSVAVDYMTLLRSEPKFGIPLATEARRLADEIAKVRHPSASVAVRHLQNIADVSERFLSRPPDVPDDGVLPSSSVAAQMRIHQYGAMDALDSAIDDRSTDIFAAERQLSAAFVAGSIGFAALSVLAFFVVFRRVGGPVQAIEQGIRALAAGEPGYRIAPQGNDELGALAQSINRMAGERQQQEALLRESENRFRQLTENIAEVFWLSDPEKTRMIYVSPAYEKVWGRKCEELYANPTQWFDAIHEDDKPGVAAAISRQISGEYSEQFRIVHADGSVRWILDRAFPVHDDAGKVYRIAGIAEDITERLQLEEKLKQAQRLESIGQLTGGVAHDFNNLLTVILGNAELLAEELAGDARRRRLAEMVVGAAQSGADLTRALLAFARKQALSPQPVDVNALLAGMEPLLRRTLGEHIDISIRHAGSIWRAFVDPAQLESALLNLSLNARDAMPRGGRLTISASNMTLEARSANPRVDLPAGEYVELSIGDTGEGIAPENIDKVFEPFFTTKDKSKGTGLGLAMVYGFARQSGGDVCIDSEPGRGTAVKLFLPCYDESTEIVHEVLPVRTDTGAPGGGETILLVEDDELVRRFAAGQLTSMGYRVLEAEHGPAALEYLRTRDDIDLLFTDIVMPGGMTGRELADAALQLHPGLKVLYTSGYTEDSIVHHGRLDPGVRLLGKPYRRSELARSIRESFGAARAAGDTERNADGEQ